MRRSMSWPTSWPDTMKTTALAALAERTAADTRTANDTRWNWDAKLVWLSRVRPSRELAAPRSITGPATQARVQP
jgi:hypothetical protein